MKLSISYLRSKDGKEETIKKLNHSTADLIHVDLMDGIFVPNKNFELEEVIALLMNCQKPLDIHLMVQNPLFYIEKLLKLNPYAITIHVESENVLESIKKIQNHNVKAGISLKPNTSITQLDPYYSIIDLVLLMSVEPGKGGQPFMMRSIKRAEELKKKQSEYHFLISVDGGITNETIQLVRNYIDIAVSGSFVCMADSLEKQLQLLRF